MPSCKRIAVIGIDGSGKSSIIQRFLALSPSERRRALTMTCPRYHETPNAPFDELSRQLDAMSTASDAIGSYELKMQAMFLQMTLYGCVERFFVDSFAPDFLLIEHHALVDTLAYGPIYRHVVKGAPDRGKVEGPLRQAMARAGSGALEAIESWHLLENERLGRKVDFWELSAWVSDQLAGSRDDILAQFSTLYQCQLPEVVIHLDLPVDIALDRLAARGDVQGELHESKPVLEQLSALYRDVIGKLPETVECFTIDTSRTGTIDETLRDIVEKACIRP